MRNTKYKNKNWLIEQYHGKQKTQSEIAKLCGVSPSFICTKMKAFNIKARPNVRRNHVEIDNNLREVLIGLLLGDGCVSTVGNTSAYYEHSDSDRDYLIYLRTLLNDLGIEFSSPIYHTKRGFMGGKKTDRFSIKSKAYVELLNIRNKWYPDGIKIVPRDIKLTKTSLFHWYVGDGCLFHQERRRDVIILCTNGFDRRDVSFLVGLLGNIGIVGSHNVANNVIRLSNENALKLIEYVGGCPEEILGPYGYKWRISNISNARQGIISRT